MASSFLKRAAERPVFWSMAAHGCLLLFMLGSLPDWRSGPDQPVRLAIDAAVVPDMEVQRERQRDAQRRREAERERQEKAREVERERQQELARQREAEQRKAEEQKRRAEQQRVAAEKRAAEEKARKAEAEKQRREAERKRAEAEKQRKAEEQARRERERVAAEKQRQAEREAQLAAELAAEQAREDAVRGGLLDQWREVMRQKVQRNWVLPADAAKGIECEVRVTQIPGGEVVNVQVSRCNANAAVARSLEDAIYRASPLPPPPNPSLFERNLIFVFKPDDL